MDVDDLNDLPVHRFNELLQVFYKLQFGNLYLIGIVVRQNFRLIVIVVVGKQG